MKRVKISFAVMLLLAFSIVNVAALFSQADAGLPPQPKYYAGFKLYGANGAVMGCDCPKLEGECVCSVTPMN